MPRILAVVLCLIGMIGAAHAATYDDFTDGLSARTRDDNARAIELLSRALDAGDLPSTYVATAFVSRGGAYWETDQCAKAAGDFTAALKLRPQWAYVFLARAGAEECLGQYTPALSDVDAALNSDALANSQRGAYYTRGVLGLLTHHFADAASDFRESATLNTLDPLYTELWLELAKAKGGAVYKESLPLTVLGGEKWRKQMLEVYLGNEKADDVDLSEDEKWVPPKLRQCQQNFFLGEWRALHGDAAKSGLQAAVDLCPHASPEYLLAKQGLEQAQ